MLELAVEATYPICEALTVSLISVSASIQGVTIMELDHYLARPISENTTMSNTVSNLLAFLIYFLETIIIFE